MTIKRMHIHALSNTHVQVYIQMNRILYIYLLNQYVTVRMWH